ncbi:hypothetical protein Hanom_Chr02g00116771 [Helianthus anomalus]
MGSVPSLCTAVTYGPLAHIWAMYNHANVLLAFSSIGFNQFVNQHLQLRS